MRSEENAPKNKEPTVGFCFTTMLQHTGLIFFKHFLAMNNAATVVHSAYYPDLGTADFYLPAGLKSSLKRGWICNDMTSLRMQWKS
jgi:hypothetical protein